LEAEFAVEIATAASKLTRDRASDIVPKLLEKYESSISSPPEGDRYQDCYDVTTGRPIDKAVRRFNEVKDELTGMGIPFDELAKMGIPFD
jgi:methylamine--corrinoid protein Co-methyltransferase